MNVFDPIRETIALSREKAQLKEREKAINQRLAELEEHVRETLIQMGDDERPGSMRLDGATVYLAPELWARPKDGDRARTALTLKSAGLGYLVKEDFNIHQLSAWVREVKQKGAEASDEERQQLAAIMDVLDLSEGLAVRVRKA